ncbi:MAG: acyl carrier protein [Desulfuromonadales bacterium]|nr:acyl carrier protein [Desulfuromonadales bacterium]MBN2793506.1 acyl carrier protein [Desulfuromonadales bacterium]
MDAAAIRGIIEKGLLQIAPEAEFDDLQPTENIREELDIDSFDFLNFLIGLNEELGVDIPESDYEKLITMNDLTAYLEEKLQ